MSDKRRPIAIVTGASSGIGRATATVLAGRGFDVGIGYRANEKAAHETAEAVAARGAAALVFAQDLADPAGAAAALDAAVERLGGVDVFVNNAGVNRRASFLEETLQDWQRVLAVDLTGPFGCAQVAARHMVRQGRGGRIVNVSSVHDTIPIAGGATYCAAKGGLSMLTKVMALELAEHDITVNAVSPGETATPMNGVPDEVDAAEVARPEIPLGRPGRSREVAELIAFLAEPGAAYLTGALITVDGGLSLMAAVANARYAGRN
uniref:Putative oxidoreductase n=1 Tax=Actinoplanes sp. A40644 TaxID=236489 RepID=Q767F9_9ACTN|nr:putative oxidoreductase [Actinoplanes sp. A40644]